MPGDCNGNPFNYRDIYRSLEALYVFINFIECCRGAGNTKTVIAPFASSFGCTNKISKLIHFLISNENRGKLDWNWNHMLRLLGPAWHTIQLLLRLRANEIIRVGLILSFVASHNNYMALYCRRNHLELGAHRHFESNL